MNTDSTSNYTNKTITRREFHNSTTQFHLIYSGSLVAVKVIYGKAVKVWQNPNVQNHLNEWHSNGWNSDINNNTMRIQLQKIINWVRQEYTKIHQATGLITPRNGEFIVWIGGKLYSLTIICRNLVVRALREVGCIHITTKMFLKKDQEKIVWAMEQKYVFN